MVRARARQMECRKTRFEPANEPVEAGFSLRAYHDVIKRKNTMKKLDFTAKNVINCVMNPRYGTQNSPTSILKLLHVSTHIIGFHFWKHSAIRIIFVGLWYTVTHVECFRFFDLAAIIAAPKLYTTTAVHATTISSSSSILRKIGRIYICHTRAIVTRF